MLELILEVIIIIFNIFLITLTTIFVSFTFFQIGVRWGQIFYNNFLKKGDKNGN